ncbi:hypothetical protein [Psychrobacter sp. NG27]|uniref:hypothetical protein n=1 Tax=Psychrobacter sp. NG27 TaxID=2781966 RepID=UPI0018E0172A|nr:hypothetical protein [Psychrobacter sp. NG27]MBI0427165.1 hypothetical protein [Psychrobacter sp. NG27]
MLVSLSVPALAVSPTNDNLLCAAYMDVILEDMTPLGLIPRDKAKFMFTDRFVKMSSLSLAEGESVSDVVSEFVRVRNKIRKDQSAASGMNSMHLYTPNQVEAYSIKLAENATVHCSKANKNLESLMKTYTTQDFVNEVKLVSDEMKKQGES